MVTQEDIVAFLDRLESSGASYTQVSDGIWNVKPGGDLNVGVIVSVSPPVVVLRSKVMDLPKDDKKLTALYRRLLELNASDILHGSYGILENDVVLTDSLQLGHLDFEEFLASYESITISLASQIRELASFREAR